MPPSACTSLIFVSIQAPRVEEWYETASHSQGLPSQWSVRTQLMRLPGLEQGFGALGHTIDGVWA
eukprot:5275540-Amphidinium_carterae.1